MKYKYLLLLLPFVILNETFGQQVLTKRHRFGFSFAYGTNFNSSKSNLMVLTDKRTPLYSYSGIYEYQHTSLLSFQTSLNLETSSAPFIDNPLDTFDLYSYNSRPHSFDLSPCNYDQLIEVYTLYYNTPPEFRRIRSRQYKFAYLSIPVEVVFRSKMRNFNRFYAKAGIRSSLRIRSKAREEYSYPGYDTLNTYNDKTIIRDANVIKFNLTCGIGAERVYTGHSTLFINLEFDLALSNTFSQNQNNANIFLGNGLTDHYPVENVKGSSDFGLNHLRQNQLRVKVGLLF